MKPVQRLGLPHSSNKSLDEIVEEHLKPIKEAFKLAADANCSTCFGRGYTGQIKDTLILVPCPKCINLESIKDDSNKKKLEETKTGDEATTKTSSEKTKQQDEPKIEIEK